MRFPLVLILCVDDSDNEVAETHAKGANGERGLAADVVDVQNGGTRSDQHHCTDNAGREETCSVAAKP